MENKENEKGFLFYVIIGLIYAVILGIMIGIFNLFTDEKTPLPSILVQSVFFGTFMAFFEYWIQSRKKNK